MEKTRNVYHEFDLSGLVEGDCFLGCRGCWFRFEPHTGAAAICPECGEKMFLYDVTEDDIKAATKRRCLHTADTNAVKREE